MKQDPTKVRPASKVPHTIFQRNPEGKEISVTAPTARKALTLPAQWLNLNARVPRSEASRWPNQLTTYGVWVEHESGYAYKIEVAS